MSTAECATLFARRVMARLRVNLWKTHSAMCRADRGIRRRRQAALSTCRPSRVNRDDIRVDSFNGWHSPARSEGRFVYVQSFDRGTETVSSKYTSPRRGRDGIIYAYKWSRHRDHLYIRLADDKYRVHRTRGAEFAHANKLHIHAYLSIFHVKAIEFMSRSLISSYLSFASN